MSATENFPHRFDSIDEALPDRSNEALAAIKSGKAIWTKGVVGYTYPESEAFMDIVSEFDFPGGEAGEILRDLEEYIPEYVAHPIYYFSIGGKVTLEAFPLRTCGFDVYEVSPRLSNPGVNYRLNFAEQPLNAQEVHAIAGLYHADDDNWPQKNETR